MTSRREFIKKSVLLSSAAGLSTVLPSSIQRALAINPDTHSTYLDAEHIVILMQENRSFDHCFGTLKGVRGFNDPRAFRLANGNPVWLQTDKRGKTYAPFRLNIQDTKSTWMGDLPHSRSSQVDAHNYGQHDKWLIASHLSDKRYSEIPFTLGYYNREDIPFNYAMADAFTVCDQNFSSAMTSTWPNRHYMWTGTIREKPHDATSRAHIRNDLDFGEANWPTYPERLEKNGISWRIYQNDLTCGGGFTGEERSWLSNFICNTFEYFSQYNVKFSARYATSLREQISKITNEIKSLKERLKSMSNADQEFQKSQNALTKKEEVLTKAQAEFKYYTKEKFSQLSPLEKNLYQKAFTTNKNDPDYHTLTPLTYTDGDTERTVNIPKGDVLYQFRHDVDHGTLPTVSWLVSPQKFSDHPSAPWYGTWMVSEILDILTKNPDVWKKTIFILTYDENDGYYDHIPSFMPPNTRQANPGKCSDGIDAKVEYIPLEQELQYGVNKNAARGSQIGLGYRVPMIVASPWSRGGRVNSQVFDHTSILQFLEVFLSQKYNKEVREDNISTWRRTICGDLTSVFTKYQEEQKKKEYILKRDPVVEKIYNAQFKQEPAGYKALTFQEVEQIKADTLSSEYLPQQEKGVKPACALPYQLYVDGNRSRDGKNIELQFQASNEIFGNHSAGSPFNVYSILPYQSEQQANTYEPFRVWHYAVSAGDTLKDQWPINAFKDNAYHLRVNGPNGFFREFKGDDTDPNIIVHCDYERSKDTLTGHLLIHLQNLDAKQEYNLEIIDNAYRKNWSQSVVLKPDASESMVIKLDKSFGWYDISVQVRNFQKFEKQYAGRVETGKEGFSDPLMGRII